MIEVQSITLELNLTMNERSLQGVEKGRSKITRPLEH